MKIIKSLLATALVVAAAGALHAQTVSVDKTALNFYAQLNGAAVSQTFNVTSSTGSPSFQLLLSPQNSWLKVSPTQTTTTPATITVTADPTGLPTGINSGTITVVPTSLTAPFPTVQITLTVGNIAVSPQSLQFVYQQGAQAPQAQTLNVTGAPTTPINFSTSVTSTPTAWLLVSPFTGTTPAAATVSVNAALIAGLAAGTYNGTVTVTPQSGSILTPIPIPVTLTVTGSPAVTVTPSTVNLVYQLGGLNNTTSQNVTLSTTGVAPISFGLTSSVDNNPSGSNWMLVSSSNTTIPAAGSTTFSIAYDTLKNLPASPTPYTGKITVFTPGGTPTQQDVNVRLTVSSAPLLSVPGDTLAFNYQVGGAVPSPKTVTATSTQVPASSGSGQMTLTISGATSTGGNWLVVPSTGITGTPFSISVNTAGLAAGTYSGTVTVTGSGAANGAQVIPVTLTVANDPQVTVTFSGCTTPSQTCSLLFPVQVGQPAPATQSVKVSSSTGATLTYTATSTTTSCGSSWLVLGGPTTGSTDGSFTVSVNSTGIAAGTQCSGNITIAAINPVNSATAPNSPVTIPVSMYVSNTALLSVNPIALTFAGQLNGAQTAPQNLAINSTSSTEQLNYTVAWTPSNGGNSWLIFGPTQSTTANGQSVVTVLAQPGLLSPGTYTGNLTITATTATGGAVADSPITVPVTFTVNGITMSVTPGTLTFNQTAGGAAPAAQTISVTSSGQPIFWSATSSTGSTGNWLSITPASGTTPGSISVSANGSGLAPGTYTGTVTVTTTSAVSSGSPTTVNVQLIVAGTLSASATSLNFTQALGVTAPANQTFTVSGSPTSLSFTTAAATTNGGNWLTVSPATGSTNGTVTVSVNGTGLTLGQYTGTVTVTSTGANGSPIRIPVTLTIVSAQGLTAAPTTLNFSYVLTNPAPASQTVQLSATGGAAQFSLTPTTSTGGNWLTATPTSGSTPATLTVSVNPTGLAAGNYTGTISVTSPASVNQVAASITVNLTVAQVAPPVVTAIKSNASYAIGPISAGENIVLGGTNLGPADLVKGQVTSANTVATLLAETQITFDGIAAPILYVSSTQSSVMVPYEVANRATVSLRVIYKGIQSDPVVLNVTSAAPGIYTQNSQGFGPGSILNQDFNVNGAGAPAAKGSVIAIYMTGEGLTIPTPVNGALAPLNGTGLFKPTLPVTATVGGIDATVAYYGSAPGIVYGVMQVNIVIPDNAPSGAVPVFVKVGAASTQTGVTVAIQ